ncbi:MAG: hypothetical protein LBV72_19485 [Tannerella sp.]|jgi:hypothetical protein|nr:hypothetical protein [Tannerella sp.]
MGIKCLFGHQWNGCKCERCAKTQDIGHNYAVVNDKCLEKCSICGKERSIEHKWDGCKCERCGRLRSEGHNLDLSAGKCTKCEKTLEEIVRTDLADAQWSMSGDSQSKYYSKRVNSLVEACEILKQLSSISPMTYYLVDTPDGTLGRDIVGFFTESPLKTKGIRTKYSCYGKSGVSVEAQSLKDYGDMLKTQSTVATLKASGQYGVLVLMMKCGQCGYESPIETNAGDMERECYFCGTNNKSHRGEVNVFTMQGMVKI